MYIKVFYGHIWVLWDSVYSDIESLATYALFRLTRLSAFIDNDLSV